jgi:hypothetical protein
MRKVERTCKLLWFPFLLTMAAVFWFVPDVSANSITFNLDCSIVGGAPCSSPNGNWGTVTLSDQGGTVGIDLVFGNPNWKLLSYDFNYNDALFNNSSDFELTSGKAVEVKENKEVLQGSGNFGGFDLEVPKNGNIGAIGSYSDTLSWNSGSLVVGDFNFKNTGGIYFGVHIGENNGSSIAVGASTIASSTPPTGTAVPEPMSLLLVGTVLAGLVLFAWRKRK